MADERSRPHGLSARPEKSEPREERAGARVTPTPRARDSQTLVIRVYLAREDDTRAPPLLIT